MTPEKLVIELRDFARMSNDGEQDLPIALTAADAIEKLLVRLSEAVNPEFSEFEVLLINEGDESEEWAAGTSGPRDQALAEARHYALQYVQDGPVKIVERRVVETLKGTK